MTTPDFPVPVDPSGQEFSPFGEGSSSFFTRLSENQAGQFDRWFDSVTGALRAPMDTISSILTILDLPRVILDKRGNPDSKRIDVIHNNIELGVRLGNYQLSAVCNNTSSYLRAWRLEEELLTNIVKSYRDRGEAFYPVRPDEDPVENGNFTLWVYESLPLVNDEAGLTQADSRIKSLQFLQKRMYEEIDRARQTDDFRDYGELHRLFRASDPTGSLNGLKRGMYPYAWQVIFDKCQALSGGSFYYHSEAILGRFLRLSLIHI